MSTPILGHIPAFHAVLTEGSLSAAARLLRLTQPTIRRHIEALEEELGQKLFTRAGNGLTPTPRAEALLPFALSVLEEAAALRRAASADVGAVEGTVRLTTSRVVATHVLPLALAQIAAEAPALRLEVAATDRSENLLQRAADIALRFAPPQQQALVAVRLRDVEIGLFAAPDFPAPPSESALAETPMILDDREAVILPRMIEAGLPMPRRVVLRCDDPLAQIAAIEAGLGVGFCQAGLAARRGLVRVLPDRAFAMPAWLVMHEDQARTARIRFVFDRLKTTLGHWM